MDSIKNKNTTTKKKNIFITVILIVSIITAVISFYIIFNWFIDNKETDKIVEKTTEIAHI